MKEGEAFSTVSLTPSPSPVNPPFPALVRAFDATVCRLRRARRRAAVEAVQRPVAHARRFFRAMGRRESVRTNHEWRQTFFRGRSPRGRSESLEPLAANRVSRPARFFANKGSCTLRACTAWVAKVISIARESDGRGATNRSVSSTAGCRRGDWLPPVHSQSVAPQKIRIW